jgi:hypothetical protein
METMELFYTWCATIAGILFLGQFVLGLLGIVDDVGLGGIDGADGLDHADGFDHAGGAFVGFFSFRALTAAVTIFGLSGLAASKQWHDPNHVFLVALASGGAVLVGVGYLIRSMLQLASSGSVDDRNAVGRTGSVYLSVPGAAGGQGKVTVLVQGRSMEYRAVTEGEPLPTGTAVVVTKFVSPGVVQVARASELVQEG